MVYKEIFALCSDIRTKHMNILHGQNLNIFYFKRDGTSSSHWNLRNITAPPRLWSPNWLLPSSFFWLKCSVTFYICHACKIPRPSTFPWFGPGAWSMCNIWESWRPVERFTSCVAWLFIFHLTPANRSEARQRKSCWKCRLVREILRKWETLPHFATFWRRRK